MPERDFRATIGYKLDPRGGQQFIAQNQNMIEAAAALHTELLAQGKDAVTIAREMAAFHTAQSEAAKRTQATETAVERLRGRFVQSKAALEAETAAMRGQITTLSELKDARNRLAQGEIAGLPEPSLGAVTGTGRQSRRGRQLGAIGTLGTTIRNLPDVGPSTEIANVLIGFDRITGSLGVSAATAATALGAMTVATIAIGGAIAIYTNLTKDQSNALVGLVRSQERYFKLLREAGTNEAENALREAQQNLEDLQAQRAEIQAELDRRFAQSQTQTLGDAGARIRTAVDSVFSEGQKAATARLGELDTQMIESAGLINRLTGGLRENAFVVNDLVDAFQNRFNGILEQAAGLISDFVDQNEARIQAQIGATNTEIAFNQQVLNLRRNFSVERLSQLRQENVDEQSFNRERIRCLQEFAGRSTAADEELARLQERQNELIREATLLHDPYLRQLEREARLLNDLANAGAILGRVFGALRKDLSGLDVSKQLTKIIEITKRRDERIAELREQQAEREEQAQKEFAKANTEADRKAADDRLKLFEDTYKRIGEIERRFTRSFQQAVGERDALAAFQAQQTREDELRDLRESNTQREQEIQRSLDRERQAAEEHRREALQIAQDTTQKQIDKERQKAQGLIDEQNRSIDRQLRAAFQFTNTLDTLFNTGYSTMLRNANTFANNLANIFLGSNRPQGAIGNLIGSVFGGGQNRPLTTGGAINQPNFAYSYNAGTGTPQQITLPNGQQQQGYIVYSPTIIGQTRTQQLATLNQHSEALLNQFYGRSNRR